MSFQGCSERLMSWFNEQIWIFVGFGFGSALTMVREGQTFVSAFEKKSHVSLDIEVLTCINCKMIAKKTN